MCEPDMGMELVFKRKNEAIDKYIHASLETGYPPVPDSSSSGSADY